MFKTAAVLALAVVAVLGSVTAAPAIAIFSAGGAGDGVGTLTCVSAAVPCGPGVVNISSIPTVWQDNNPGGSSGVWVSFDANHGVNGPNVAAPDAATGNETVTFNYSFSLATPAQVSFSVWADDTAEVFVDGISQIAGNGTQGVNCAVSPIGCTDGNFGVVSVLLGTGNHNIDFAVYQRVLIGDTGTPFGLLFAGELTPVPEPASILLLGSALTAVGMASRRRWFSKKS